MAGMSKEPITFTQAGMLNDYEIAVGFSDGTIAVMTVEQVLACVPDRTKDEEPSRQ